MSGDPFHLAAQAAGLALPPAVAAFHRGSGTRIWHGEAEVETGRNPVSRLVARMAGFPARAGRATIRVTTETAAGRSRWARDFQGHVTRSALQRGTDRTRVIERMGLVTLTLALRATAGRLHIDVAGIAVLGVPLPRFLCPISETIEYQDAQGRFAFDVSARLPMLGRLIRYHGHLTELEPTAPIC